MKLCCKKRNSGKVECLHPKCRKVGCMVCMSRHFTKGNKCKKYLKK